MKYLLLFLTTALFLAPTAHATTVNPASPQKQIVALKRANTELRKKNRALTKVNKVQARSLARAAHRVFTLSSQLDHDARNVTEMVLDTPRDLLMDRVLIPAMQVMHCPDMFTLWPDGSGRTITFDEVCFVDSSEDPNATADGSPDEG